MVRILTWLAITFAAVVALAVVTVAVSLLSPPPALEIGKQTTVITEPLRPDGTPDYEAYLLARGREGVTPENNAAVLLVEALWPAQIDPADQPAVLKALGMTERPSEADALTPLDDPEFLEELEDSFTGLVDTERIVKDARTRPWKSDQAPALAEWIRANQRPLDLICEASERPRFWFPSPTYLNGEYDMLIDTLLPLAAQSRNASYALASRSMHHLGEGRTDQAWRDAMATHRLARHVAEGDTLVEALVAYAIDAVAAEQAVAVLHHANLPPEQARNCLRELQQLQPLPEIWTFIDCGERLMYVDGVLAVAKGQHSEFSERFAGRLDPNAMLREGGAFYDEVVEIAQHPNSIERVQVIRDYGDALEDRLVETSQSYRVVLSPFSRSVRSKLMSNAMVALMYPHGVGIVTAEDRHNASQGLTLTAAALAVYRAEQGEYPERLAQLVPDILAEEPVDRFSEKPFRYVRKPDGGYLLYSVGQNGVDNGGNSYTNDVYDGEWTTDPEEREVAPEDGDIVIRVPLPPFTTPASEQAPTE